MPYARVRLDGLTIWRMDTAGNNQTQVTTHGNPPFLCDNDPDFSPDGNTIVFSRGPQTEGCDSPVNLFTVPATGGRSGRDTA